jgi:hypothetical protein
MDRGNDSFSRFSKRRINGGGGDRICGFKSMEGMRQRRPSVTGLAIFKPQFQKL